MATCERCGDEFEPARSDAKFCGPACSQKAYRQRRSVTDNPAEAENVRDSTGSFATHIKGGAAGPEKKEESVMGTSNVKDTELFTTTKQQMRDAREGRPLLPTFVVAKREFTYDGVHRDSGEIFTLEHQLHDRRLWEHGFIVEAPESGLAECECCDPPREFVNGGKAKTHTLRVEADRRAVEVEEEKAKQVLWTCPNPNCRRYILHLDPGYALNPIDATCPGCRRAVRFDMEALPAKYRPSEPEPADDGFDERERVLAEI